MLLLFFTSIVSVIKRDGIYTYQGFILSWAELAAALSGLILSKIWISRLPFLISGSYSLGQRLASFSFLLIPIIWKFSLLLATAVTALINKALLNDGARVGTLLRRICHLPKNIHFQVEYASDVLIVRGPIDEVDVSRAEEIIKASLPQGYQIKVESTYEANRYKVDILKPSGFSTSHAPIPQPWQPNVWFIAVILLSSSVLIGVPINDGIKNGFFIKDIHMDINSISPIRSNEIEVLSSLGRCSLLNHDAIRWRLESEREGTSFSRLHYLGEYFFFWFTPDGRCREQNWVSSWEEANLSKYTQGEKWIKIPVGADWTHIPPK